MITNTINIAITAGGTSEPIDGVRKITNLSTGSLGWHCLESVLEYFKLQNSVQFQVYYILTENAVHYPLTKEEENSVQFIKVFDAESVYQAVDNLTKTVNIDFFIHAMAVSDFTFSYAMPTHSLATQIFNFIQEEKNISVDKIEKLLNYPTEKHAKEQKISSKNNLIMGLKKTKKVISLIKKNNKNTFLVGFKLLNSATEKELMEAAQKLTATNNCNMVLANDATAMSANNHKGLLIQNGRIIARPTSKKEIASAIIENMLSDNEY